MQASPKLVLVYLAVLSAYAMSSDAARPLREIRGHPNGAPVRLSTILTNEVTNSPDQRAASLMGGHMKITTTPSSREEDEAQWDDGLILSSAGNGKENRKPHDDDDEKKTLAQQVKEGKYGLIQDEIYPKKSKRPGILSYLSNPEVPKDTSKNLGGLDEDEIWLAENHVLVLRGGNFPEHETEQPSGDLRGWSPIDDFQAPKRQVKIPSSPQVPPPFPIQLNEGGPVTVLGSNDTDKPQWFDGLISPNETIFYTDRNDTTKENPQTDRKTKSGLSLGGIVGPFFPSLPPGAVFLPPPGNQSDYDDDDQSIYYPPPYSFKYNQDNSTAVPPGPLVPGIILPPPPDFFSQLEEKKTTKSHITKYPKRPTTTSKPPAHLHRKSHPKPHKFISSSSTSSTKEPRPFTMKPLNKFKLKNTTSSSTETTNPSKQVLPYVEVTTSAPNKVSTLEISEISTVRPIVTNQVIETSTEGETEKPRWTGSALKSPIVAYYGTSPSPIDEAVDISRKRTKARKIPPSVPSSASYYFYEEATDDVSGTTSTPIYFQETTTRAVDYATEAETKKPYYQVDTSHRPPAQYQVEIEVIEQVMRTSPPRYQYPDTDESATIPVSPRSQSQRMLTNSPVFFKNITDRPKLNLNTFFITPPPKRYNQQQLKPKPVYQYSFEAADYAQRGRQKELYKPLQEVQPGKQVTFNEWQEEIEDVDPQYNDYNTEVVPEQRLQPERTHYRMRAPSYPTTTIRSNIVDTTPNPQHAYYTKQDERLLDDVTREYFTNFGRKINRDRVKTTTPIYGKTSVTERPNYSTVNSVSTNSFDERQKTHTNPRVEVHYGGQTHKPFSLEGDTRVNYQEPLPPMNPDAEFLPGYGPKKANDREQLIERFKPSEPIRPYIPVDEFSGEIRETAEPTLNYPYSRPTINPDAEFSPAYGPKDNEWEQEIDRFKVSKPIRQYIPVEDFGEDFREPTGPTRLVPLDDKRERQRVFPTRLVPLSGDTAVNYRDPRPPINPDAEFIDPVNNDQAGQGKPSSYFSYRLPGDGGHFYFLTPHAISRRQGGNSFASARQGRGSRNG
ncbi:adhesive plaque matrix protein isoform X2 [Diachasmimorpha longicaudata]